MSSLSAARADNYYYPREWRPELGSINAFQGSHPLGRRAKDLATQRVLVVRFEMPFNVWCTHCETHIGRGVRFNARKRKCGMYFSTILYEFALTCTHCQGEMAIRTDPEHRGYKLVSGVRKKVEGADVVGAYDTIISGGGGADDTAVVRRADEIGTERLNDPQVGAMLQADPFFRLEHESEDKRVASQRARGLEALLELKDAHDKDNYGSNAGLRAAFRSQKKQIKRREDEGEKRGLSIPLLDVHEDDVVAAKAVVYKNIPRKKRASHNKSALDGKRGGAMVVLHKSHTGRRVVKTKSDSFQHFGDAMGSQLHRMKQAKRLAQQQQLKMVKTSMDTAGSGNSSKKRKSSGGGGATPLAVRASKLLRR